MPSSTNKFGLSKYGESNHNPLGNSTTSSIGMSRSGDMSTTNLYSWSTFDDDDQGQNDWGLHRAVTKGDSELVKFALQNGQSPNTLKEGISPLHSAAWSGNESSARLLLAYGAEVDIGGIQNQRSFADLLMDKFGSCPIGFTPLHLASLYGHASIVRLLLDHGAKSTLLDRNGHTPANLAQRNGHGVVAELLNIWSSTHAHEGRSNQGMIMNREDSQSSNMSMHQLVSDNSANRPRNKLMSSLNRQRSIEHLSNAAAGFKTSIQNSTKHVLSRVSSNPTLRSSEIAFSQNQNYTSTSPKFTSFASSIAKDLKTKASTVFGSSTANDNQSRQPRHRPSVSSMFEKDSNSSEGRNSFAQSTSVLQMNTNNTKVDGTIRKMIRHAGNKNLAGLSIRPGKVRERRGCSRGEAEMHRSASFVSSFYSSTDSLPIQNSSSAKEVQFTALDDRARWDAIFDAQQRSSISPLNFEVDGRHSRMSELELQKIEAPYTSELRAEYAYGCSSPLSALGYTQDDAQEMLEQTAESYDLLSKHKYANYGPSFRSKNSTPRTSPSNGFDMTKELSSTPDYFTTPKRQKTAAQFAEAIFQGAEVGYKWYAEDGKSKSLRDMLADYGEALAFEREEAKRQALHGTQMQLFSSSTKKDDYEDDYDNGNIRLSTSLEGIMDISGISSSLDLTRDTNLPHTPSGSFVSSTNWSGEKSGTCSIHSSSSANTIKKGSSNDRDSSHLQPTYPFLLATSQNKNTNESQQYKFREASSFHKHRRTSNYSPIPYNSQASSTSLASSTKIRPKGGDRSENRGRTNQARDSFGSTSSLSNVSCGTAI